MALTPYYSKAEADQKNKETFREVESTVNSISAGEGGKSFATLADAQAVSPVPSDGTVFQVENDGYYIYDSTATGGTRFLRDFVYDLNDQELATIEYGGYVFDTLAEAQALTTKPLDNIAFSVKKSTDPINAGYYTFQSLEANGTKFEKPLTDYESIEKIKEASRNYINISGTEESVLGYYDSNTGNFVANSGWFSKKFSVDTNKKYFATGVVSGAVTALAVFYDINNGFLGSQNKGVSGVTDSYTKKELIIPNDTAFIGISTKDEYGILEEGVVSPFTRNEIEAINSKAVSANTSIDSIKNAAPGYEKLSGTEETTNGFYDLNGVFTANQNKKAIRFSITDTEKYYATSTVNGGALALAVYYGVGDAFLGFEFRGTSGVDEVYTRQNLTIPEGTVSIGINNQAPNFGVLEKEVFKPATQEQINQINTSKKSKKILWLGTSIPAGGYPQIVGQKLEANVNNEAVSASMARAFHGTTGTFKNLNYINCLKSLSQTMAEKQNLMDYWVSGLDADGNITGGSFGWRDLLTGTPPADYATFASAETILSWSYERKIVAKYLDETSPDFLGKRDFFVFDHGHNDLASGAYDATESEAISIPTDPKDRSRFAGAINYLIDVILSYNPRARIIFIGHYENDRKKRIYQAQEIVAEYWDFPLIKLWEKLGWSQKTVQTTGFWSNGVWSDSGGASQSLTLTQIWLEDDLHPFSEDAKELISNVLTQEVKKCF